MCQVPVNHAGAHLLREHRAQTRNIGQEVQVKALAVQQLNKRSTRYAPGSVDALHSLLHHAAQYLGHDCGVSGDAVDLVLGAEEDEELEGLDRGLADLWARVALWVERVVGEAVEEAGDHFFEEVGADPESVQVLFAAHCFFQIAIKKRNSVTKYNINYFYTE